MPVVEWIVIGILALGAIAGITVHFGWSISTQHRDHGAVASGPVTRRRIWSRRPPASHAGPVNAGAIPGATADQSAARADKPGQRI